ncbi:hypothetical protein FRAHR75_250034 [Frankia sp. Hr75.2]|nr:hypothetical protein FRAHR75_250034 [Frankia sp. Hr75.2]
MTQESVPSYHPNVRADRDGFVVTVTIDRPESRNACTGDMWVALGRIFREVGHSGALDDRPPMNAPDVNRSDSRLPRCSLAVPATRRSPGACAFTYLGEPMAPGRGSAATKLPTGRGGGGIPPDLFSFCGFG